MAKINVPDRQPTDNASDLDKESQFLVETSEVRLGEMDEMPTTGDTR